jgi:hypothetical protein
MAYTKTTWVEPQGSYLNRFKKQNETATSVELIQDPVMTNQPTPFSVENMNKMEQGIYEAHQGIASLSDLLTAHADMVDGVGRNLLSVLGVGSIQAAMAALRVRCNDIWTPNFHNLMIGDYLEGIDLSAIPAENGGDAGQAWNNTYNSNRITLAGFNTYKEVGDSPVHKNHLLFIFKNIPLRKRMNPIDNNTGGYAASEIRAFLEGANGDGTGDYAGPTAVTTAAFLNALKAQIGDCILPVRRLLSDRPPSGVGANWRTCSLFLPSEHEVFGESTYSDHIIDDGLKVQFPIYQKASTYRSKRYNGSPTLTWECSPNSNSAATFCCVWIQGQAGYHNASAIGGCAPAFCIA